MKSEIKVLGPNSADLTRDLAAWLIEEPSLRGRIDVIERDPPAGALGPVIAAIEATLAPGGAFAALATVAVTWLRYRKGQISISISAKNGRPGFDVTAERVHGLDAEGIRELIAQVSTALGAGHSEQDTPPGGEGHGGT